MWNILLQWSYSGGAVSNFLIYVWSYCKVEVIDVQYTVICELSMVVLFNEIIQNINVSKRIKLKVLKGGSANESNDVM